MRIFRKYWPIALVGTIWILFLFVGFWYLLSYSNTPGKSAAAPSAWPATTQIEASNDLPTLLIFAHPHCACSEASIAELDRLMTHIQNKVRAYVLFYIPQNKDGNWAKENLWKKALKIPGVYVHLDEGGKEAEKFDVHTSGQVLLYSKTGELVFRGGITPERGHHGDSAGRDSILEFIATGKNTSASTPVFGCSLKNPERLPAGVKP